MQPPILLGPFRMLAPIAQGGMGEVWKGEHVEGGLPVAVKLMTTEAAREPRYRAAFADEVRHMASLDHPAIAVVYDHGDVDDAAARASVGRLAAGSPYLVMEYASGGTLSDASVGSWRALKAIALSLLDALAHAHARGVVHRDLKPGNVLIGAPTDIRPGLKLTDFGIARAMDGPVRTHTPVEVAGTLTYMAPEQILGRWRDDGPWTDLYALGGVTWRLATGRSPFHGLHGGDLRRAHLVEEPPAFVPRVPIPVGFEAWLRRLLHKEPHGRWQRAADAAWALLDLEDPEESALVEGLRLQAPPLLVAGATTLYQDPDLIPTDLPELQADDLHLVDTGGAVARPMATLRHDAPPLPSTWRRPPGRRPPPALRGAGLALWGLRRTPIVAREAERDTIWASLRRVHEERRAAIVVVRGPQGVGRRQLLDAFVERAHELGAAHVLHAQHTPDEVPGQALARMAIRQLRTAHLWRPEVEERVEAWLDAFGGPDPDDAAALTELLCPATPRDVAAGARVVRLQGAAERHAVLRRMIERLATDRAVILRLDEVQYGPDALDFANYLAESQTLHPSAVLVLLTVQDDTLAERAWESARLRRLASRPEAAEIAVGPLARAQHAEFVQELLPLEPALARIVEERTSNTPLLAVQLLGDLVQRGALEPGPMGFCLRPGATVNVPDDVHAAWIARVQRRLEGLGPQAQAQLERAAVLGREVDRREWADVGGAEHAEVRSAVLDRLLQSRAVVRTDAGFLFTNDTLREALLRAAAEGGRLGEHHTACARRMKRLASEGVPDVSERLGRHLLGAGRVAEAIEPLLKGAAERRETVGYRGALSLIEVVEEAIERVSLPAADPRRGLAIQRRAWLERMTGDLDRALATITRGSELALENGWSSVAYQLANERAQVHMMRYEPALARAALHHVIAQPGLDDDPAARGRLLFSLGNIASMERQHGEAMRLLAEAAEIFEGVDELGAIDCRRSIAAAALDAGDRVTARRMALEVSAEYERRGIRFGVAECLTGLGEIARHDGDLSAAEAAYRRAVALYEAMGSGQAVLPRINLAITQRLRGDISGARASFEIVLRNLSERDRPQLIGTTHALLLPCVAALADWPAWDQHAREAKLFLTKTGFADPDIVGALDEAAALARAHGHLDKAGDATALADAQRSVLKVAGPS